MNTPARTQFQVALMGFSSTERIMLSSMFRLSSQRLPSYSLSHDPFLSDIIAINADDADAVADLEQLCAERNLPSVWVGAHAAAGKIVIPRPITWNAIFQALDGIVQETRARDSALDPLEPHTIPLGDWVTNPDSVASNADDSEATSEPVAVSIPQAPWALVVAHDQRLRQFLAHSLALGGFNAEEIDDVRLALAMNAARDYFCIFVQSDMKRVSGFSLSRLLRVKRKNEPWVVLVLPEKTTVLRLRAVWAGACNTLTQPITRDAMRQVVNQLRQEAQAAAKPS
jgi:ActR/RegA family two-component response regulator